MTTPYMPEDAERRVCAVCARGLQRLVDTHTGEVEYLHPIDMELADTDDHPPVPASPNEITADTRCDFCFLRNPQWIVPVQDFEYQGWTKLGLPLRGASVGSWSACDTCADLVNRGLWSNLVRRASEAYRHTTAEMELDAAYQDETAIGYVDDQIRTTYRQLRKNIIGAPRHLNG